MSGGYCYGESEPIEACPWCGTPCRADFVDIGVGYTQCGPYHCENCGASERSGNDAARELTPKEIETGWYGPGSEPSEHANVIAGKHVSHRVMRDAYEQEFTGNPRYNEPGVVEQWWKDIRK